MSVAVLALRLPDRSRSGPSGAGRREEFAGGRLLAALVARRWSANSGVDAGSSRRGWTTAAHGRPRLGNGHPDVNISHSRGWVVAAAAARVGVDLEMRERLPKLVERALARDRRVSLMPVLHWACKEAVLKYFGCGIGPAVDQVSIVDHDRVSGNFAWMIGPGLKPAESVLYPEHGVATRFGGGALAVVWR